MGAISLTVDHEGRLYTFPLSEDSSQVEKPQDANVAMSASGRKPSGDVAFIDWWLFTSDQPLTGEQAECVVWKVLNCAIYHEGEGGTYRGYPYTRVVRKRLLVKQAYGLDV